MFGIHTTVGQHENIVSRFHRIHRQGAQRSQLRLYARSAPFRRIFDVQQEGFEFAVGVFFDVADFRHVFKGQNRLRHFDSHRWIGVVNVQQIRFRTDEADQRHHHLLTDRVNRRIGHLREQLTEIVVKRFVFVGQHGQCRVIAH